MFRYDAVLFDLDGTLLNTLDDITHALNHVLTSYNHPTYSPHEVAGFLGSGASTLLERALKTNMDDAQFSLILNDFKRYYDQHPNRYTRPFDGIVPMLTALDEAGLQLAVISNKDDPTVKQLSKLHFGSLIRFAAGARNDVPIKPAPDMLQVAMQELDTTPERTLYIGDSLIDYQAAQNAETDCILVRWGYGDPDVMSLLSPKFFAHDAAELPMLILQQEDAP